VIAIAAAPIIRELELPRWVGVSESSFLLLFVGSAVRRASSSTARSGLNTGKFNETKPLGDLTCIFYFAAGDIYAPERNLIKGVDLK
jgi:hypothetical protein